MQSSMPLPPLPPEAELRLARSRLQLQGRPGFLTDGEVSHGGALLPAGQGVMVAWRDWSCLKVAKSSVHRRQGQSVSER